MICNSIFDKVVVMGIGTVAANCAYRVKKCFDNIIFVETRSNSLLAQESFCNKKGITYYNLGVSKSLVTEYLNTISDKTLVVSVSNRYIFPEEIVNKQNLFIINYHGALLPKYPGRNAEAWAIYNNESEGGITWHIVSNGIDAGEIITQVKVPITNKTTSFSLLREYGKAAQSSFANILDDLLKGNIKTSPQQGNKSPLYLAKMRPNGNVFNPEWDEIQMSCFLRAMDYGPLEILGKPIYKGKSVQKYSISYERNSTDSVEEYDNEIIVRKENITIRLTL